MGEAKRKRMAQVLANQMNSISDTPQINQQDVAHAVQKVVSAITDFHGADCLLLYAHVGASLLRSLGINARPVAGSAVWRVGDGDADVISHAREIGGPKFVQQGAAQAHVFHAWIETDEAVIDFSTFTLRSKAQQLDAADGGSTTVNWCPSFIWQKKTSAISTNGTPLRQPRAVLMAPKSGAFNYTRHADIEAIALTPSKEFTDAIQSAFCGVELAYAAITRGEEMNVICVSEDGVCESALAAPLVRIREH